MPQGKGSGIRILSPRETNHAGPRGGFIADGGLRTGFEPATFPLNSARALGETALCRATGTAELVARMGDGEPALYPPINGRSAKLCGARMTDGPGGTTSCD